MVYCHHLSSHSPSYRRYGGQQQVPKKKDLHFVYNSCHGYLILSTLYLTAIIVDTADLNASRHTAEKSLVLKGYYILYHNFMIAYLVAVFAYKQLAVAFAFAESVVTKSQTKPRRADWHGPGNQKVLAMYHGQGQS